MNDKIVLEILKNTKIFKEETKNRLISYFDSLNQTQKDSLIQILKVEKKLILNFLKSLKDKESMNFVDIKSWVENLRLKKIYRLEMEENKNLMLELENLIKSLDYI